MKKTRLLGLIVIALAICALTYSLASRSVKRRQVELAWRMFTRELANDQMVSAYANMSNEFKLKNPLSTFIAGRWCDRAHPWFVAVDNRDIHVVFVHLNPLGTESKIISTTSIRPSLFELNPGGIRVAASLVREGDSWRVNSEPSVSAD